MGEADLGRAAAVGQLEPDLGVDPLGLVVDEADAACGTALPSGWTFNPPTKQSTPGSTSATYDFAVACGAPVTR
ncbi:MAG TPA: hypothetical protein VFB74_22560 [Kribbellaceae bacterium]|nr:hypothetical protein [Kribbellaceae bacterium]